jgi:hypothetical protein
MASVVLYTDRVLNASKSLAIHGVECRYQCPDEIKLYGSSVKIFRTRDEVASRLSEFYIMSDLDVVFLGDPFKMFDESSADILYTTRHYPYKFSVNTGILGFRNTTATLKFLDFAAGELASPTWVPLVRFMEQHGHTKSWIVDQDLFCVLNDTPGILPSHFNDVHAFDIGPRFNFCPDYDEHRGRGAWEMVGATARTGTVVIHLKGAAKRDFSRRLLIRWQLSRSARIRARAAILMQALRRRLLVLKR